ncbi:MAG: penicillin acylase family protein [Acidimicrobiales bacterium]
MPAWGTGQWDWQGLVPRAAQPWDLNPAKGWISSWNNRQAPGWRAADDSFNLGPVHRGQLLDRRIEAATVAVPVGRRRRPPGRVRVADGRGLAQDGGRRPDRVLGPRAGQRAARAVGEPPDLPTGRAGRFSVI